MARNSYGEKSGWRAANALSCPSVEEIQRLLSPWLASRRIIGIDRLQGGLMNRNCRLHLDASPKTAVLRIYDREASACAKEIKVLQRVAPDVPVPAVFYSEADPAGHIPPFAVLEFVEGVTLKDLNQTNDADGIAEAAYSAGRLLAQLGRHRFPASGLLTPQLTVDSSFLDGSVTTSGLIELFARSPFFQRRVDPTLQERLMRAAHTWDECAPTGDEEARLVHGDFNRRNLIVKRGVKGWTIAAILDWEFAFAGPVSCDIGNFLRYEVPAQPRFEPFFSRGCRDGGLELPDGWLAAARMADLPALCDLLSRDALPEDVVAELLGLVTATADMVA